MIYMAPTSGEIWGAF